MGFVAAQIVSFHALTIVIRCVPLEAAVGPEELSATADAVLLGVGVGDREGEALALLGLGEAVVAGAIDTLLAAGLVATAAEVPAPEPSAAFWVPSGPAVVSQTAAETATSTASTESTAVRAVRRLAGFLLLRSMPRRLGRRRPDYRKLLVIRKAPARSPLRQSPNDREYA